MTRFALACAALLVAGPAGAAEQRMLFWNLTTDAITNLVMAPAGTGTFGPNQCANDRDGSVDHDERLRLTGIQPGRYDVRLTQKHGRVCTIPGVEVRAEGRVAFSLADEDLKDCK